MLQLWLIFFVQVDSAWAAGNYEDAKSKSKIAKILNIIGFIVGLLTWLAVMVFVIASVVVSAAGAQAAVNDNQ